MPPSRRPPSGGPAALTAPDSSTRGDLRRRPGGRQRGRRTTRTRRRRSASPAAPRTAAPPARPRSGQVGGTATTTATRVTSRTMPAVNAAPPGAEERRQGCVGVDRARGHPGIDEDRERPGGQVSHLSEPGQPVLPSLGSVGLGCHHHLPHPAGRQRQEGRHDDQRSRRDSSAVGQRPAPSTHDEERSHDHEDRHDRRAWWRRRAHPPLRRAPGAIAPRRRDCSQRHERQRRDGPG